MNEYEDKKILITGASKGLGLLVAEGYGAKGARIFATARSADLLKALVDGLQKQDQSEPDRHGFLAADLLDTDAVSTLADTVLSAMGTPDIIIHCMGGGYGFHDPLLAAEQLDKLFGVNVKAGAEINRLLVPAMTENGGGYILHVGSAASTQAIASTGYNTVKAALAAYVRSLGNELAAGNVIVTGILPGGFFAPDNSFRRMEADKPDVLQKFIDERLPRGFMADGAEILPLIYFLTSPGASMMAGSCIPIDAGESRAYAK